MSAWAFRHVRLATAGLYPVASLAAAAIAFGAGQVLHGSGFLAVYLTGLTLGSTSSPAARTVQTFHDGLAWVAQIVLFLSLGLLVFPSRLPGVALEGLAVTGLLLLVARPIGVLVGTLGARFSLPELALLSWAGLRGAVPVVLATFPVIDHLPGSGEFFDVVFFAVLASTLLQGSSVGWVAERLGVTTDEEAQPEPLADPETIRRLGAEVVVFPVRDGDAWWSAGACASWACRGRRCSPCWCGATRPSRRAGSTYVHAGDRLHVLVRQEVAVEFRALLTRWRTGPIEIAPRPRPARRSLIFSERPWREADGDAARPTAVGPIAVAYQLRTRRDRPGAVVVLADGRYAYVGSTAAVGSAQAVQRAARRRLGRATEDDERAWWREVIGALAVGG